MSQSSLEVTDKDGWRKEFLLRKTVTYIGSDPSSDIVLETWHGSGVVARHIQLISLATEGQGYRLVNLGDTDLLTGASGEKAISPRSFVPLSDGERIRLGEFSIIFHAGESAPAVAGVAMPVARTAGAAAGVPRPVSNVIGLKLNLPGMQLSPDHPIEGTIMVTNLGNMPGVQFKLEVQDLEADCYDIGPGPVLFPGVEKSVMFRLRHPCKPKPPAGEHRFSIRATAPDAYPGEATDVSQVVQILPFYGHKLRLVG